MAIVSNDKTVLVYFKKTLPEAFISCIYLPSFVTNKLDIIN